MEFFAFSLLAVLGFVAAEFSGACDGDQKNRRYSLPLAFLSIVFLAASVFFAYTTGEETALINSLGKPIDQSVKHYNALKLQNEEIYEVIGSITLKEKEYLVAIKDRSNNQKIYKLDTVPPKIFKYVEKSQPPYVSFPEKQ